MLFKNIPPYSVLTFPTAFLCVSFGFFVLFKNFKSKINRLYFLFCIATAIWLFCASLQASKLFSDDTSTILGRWLYSGVVFMPTLALHFAVTFLGKDLKINIKRDLRIAYSLTFIFLYFVWTSNNFIEGIYKYSWGFYSKGGYIHYVHTVFIMATALYATYLLWGGMKSVMEREGRSKRYYEIKYLLLAFSFVTCGSSDFLHNWGVDFFPVGFIFVILFITCTTYAIFRHGVFGISVVVRKGLIYSALLSTIAALYFSTVYLIGTFIGDLTKAHSAPVTLAILTIITLIFKPLESKIREFVDRLFFRQPREILEKENVKLRDEVQKTDQMKAVATLAAGMAHEIKNPLTTIRTFAEYLPEKYDEPDFRDKFKRIVTEEVDRVNNIVRQLLEFSKPKELDLKEEEIVPILDDTLNLLNNNLLKNQIDLLKDYKAYPKLLLDKNQMKQVFLNLFLNSIQAMPKGGTLTVSTHLIPDACFLISVSDTGTGIPKENLAHIFDPFFTTKSDGTGLGLPIVHGIIARHGGRIEAESLVNNGATIKIFFEKPA